ncbi:MAG TPA: triose-phosphate isomerase [bacterium]|nr:triose-phosphate isomerase [bacterium]
MKLLIIANWKSNPTTLKGAKLLFNSVKKNIKYEVVICPPFIYLPFLNSFYISKGGQNCFYEQNGAFTGEVSPKMLKDIGCKYVIIGHSERRKYFNETDEIINKKIKAALEIGLKVIFCIGENKSQRRNNKIQTVLRSQIKKGLNNISKKDIKNIIIAYEPIWAIGTGKACKAEDLQKVILIIKKVLFQKIQIIYGGSVNSKNAQEYIKKTDASGLLIGGVSLKLQEFAKILKNIN